MPIVPQLQAVTDDYVLNTRPVDVFFRANVLLFKLLSRGNTYDGGKKIKTFLEYDHVNRGAYGPRSLIPIGKNEIITAAFFPYAAYYASATIDMDDQLMNAGDAAVVDLTIASLRNMEKSIRDVMGTQIYQSRAVNQALDPDSLPFNGTADLFSQVLATEYGEIAPNDMPNRWIAGSIAAQRVMSFAFMQELRRAASLDVTKEGKPDLYITTELLLDAFERTQQVQVRYSDKKLLDAGFDNVLFKSAPVVADSKQTAGLVDAFNTGFLDIKTHAKRNFTKPEWQSPIQQPDTATCNIRWAGNLICSNRLAHARALQVIEP
jgi:hypothetical protein